MKIKSLFFIILLLAAGIFYKFKKTQVKDNIESQSNIVVEGWSSYKKYTNKPSTNEVPVFAKVSIQAIEAPKNIPEFFDSGSDLKAVSIDETGANVEERDFNIKVHGEEKGECIRGAECYFSVFGYFKINMNQIKKITKIKLFRNQQLLTEVSVEPPGSERIFKVMDKH